MFRVVVFLLLAFLASCVYHDIPRPVNCGLSTLQVDVSAIDAASGCGIQDGTIRATASGGIKPYTFSINDQLAQPDSLFENLEPGVYSIKVRDNVGCERYIDNIVVLAEGVSFTTTLQEDNICIGGNGSISIVMLEGNGPYQYKFGDEEFSDNNMFTNLPTGSYRISVRDIEDCIVELNITVPRGNTGVSWNSDILPIMTTHCATSGCHNGTSRPDLRNYQTSKFYAHFIKQFTQDRSMPFEGTLTQNQIDRIACWVDDGAPLN